ncbi:hypothetical protein HDZ31DRAFT_8874, partial [Schizophyllum fasciatum]
MTDKGDRRSPRLNPPADSNPKPTLAPKPLPRKGKNIFPGPLNLPSASLPLPTPLSSGSINNDQPLLPSIDLPDTVTQTATPTLPAPPKSPPAAPQLPQSVPASPTSDIKSEDETMSPIITIAPGITVASHGKVPRFEGTAEMEKSLAAPSTCTSVVDKIRAWASAQVLEDGKFMQRLLPYFETRKMVNDISCTASEHLWTLDDLTFDQLETVFRDTYVIGGQAAFLKTFRTFKRIHDKTPLEFYNRVDRMNFDIPASEMSTTQEIITRVGENFPEDFAEFCEHNDAFATLATYQLPKVVDGDATSLASYRGSISTYKRLLDKAWASHRVASQRVSARVDNAINAALRSYGITDARKRGLSATSHAAQLPDPKRAPPAPSYPPASLGHSRYVPPLSHVPRATTVNTVAPLRTGTRVWNNLQPHLDALNAFHGCYKCFMLNTSHGKMSCTYALDQPIVPRYDLSDPAIMQIIQADIVNARQRDVPLARVEDIISRRLAEVPSHTASRTSAATGVNAVPLAPARVNTVPAPAAAHISPNSSFE